MHFRKTAHILKQGSIPVGCISPVLRRMGGGGGLSLGSPWTETAPRTETPRRNMGPGIETPRRNMGPGTETTLPRGTWDQAARQEVASYRNHLSPPSEQNDTRFLQYYLSTNFICNTVKHFRTLSQTGFPLFWTDKIP